MCAIDVIHYYRMTVLSGVKTQQDLLFCCVGFVQEMYYCNKLAQKSTRMLKCILWSKHVYTYLIQWLTAKA